MTQPPMVPEPQRPVRPHRSVPGSWGSGPPAALPPLPASPLPFTSPLVGREAPRSKLAAWLDEARGGGGTLVLVAGEAGIGKSRLVREVLADPPGALLTAAAVRDDGTPFAPVVQILRDRLRRADHQPSAFGPLAPHLAPLLPELGPPPSTGTDRGTLFEAVRCAFAEAAAASGVATAFLDDLHWADEATLELLLALEEGLAELPFALVGTYRTDELAPDHALRRFRAELRRRGRLREIVLEPLSPEESAELVTWLWSGAGGAAAEKPAGSAARGAAAGSEAGAPPPELVGRLHLRAQGVPFYLEELAAAGGLDGPLPDSIRDAVLLRTHGLPESAQQVLEAAAVLGGGFSANLLEEVLAGPPDLAVEGAVAGVDRPPDHQDPLALAVARGLLAERQGGEFAFRHDLIREAIYQGLSPSRRRELHGRAAHALAGREGPSDALATHWAAARERDRARRALVEAAESSCRVHAYRDAVRQARQALELWPPGRDEAERIAVLDRLGRCAELSGELDEAIRSWAQVARARREAGNLFALAETRRRMAAVHALAGAWDLALAAHGDAADAFARHGLPGEAAAERLVAADLLEAAGRRRRALELAITARNEAHRADRADLEARALGLEGQLRVEFGETETGLQAVRQGLSLALARDLTGPAGELHYRLASALGEAGEYGPSRDIWEAGLAHCQAHGLSEVEQLCLACYAGVLLEVGEWDRSARTCRELASSADSDPVVRLAAGCILGVLEGLRGNSSEARRLLLETEEGLRAMPPFVALELSVHWGVALADELDGRFDDATERIRVLRARWGETDDLYYVVHPLRWAATFLAGRGLESEVRACADVLASVAAAKGSPEALAALAHVLGECALLDGDAEGASGHFDKARELLVRIGLPFQEAHTRARLAAALAATGQKEAAAHHLSRAYHAAHRMGAEPQARTAVEALRGLGVSLEFHLGKRATHRIAHGGLTRRERQVMGLVALGRSNRAIARELFLSPRTVEMHVSNALQKLGAANRTEAAGRARALGILP